MDGHFLVVSEETSLRRIHLEALNMQDDGRLSEGVNIVDGLYQKITFLFETFCFLEMFSDT